jgi:hypothetical protein
MQGCSQQPKYIQILGGVKWLDKEQTSQISPNKRPLRRLEQPYHVFDEMFIDFESHQPASTSHQNVLESQTDPGHSFHPAGHLHGLSPENMLRMCQNEGMNGTFDLCRDEIHTDQSHVVVC